MFPIHSVLHHFQYSTHGILNIAAGLFDISVGLVVLLNNPRSSLNRWFFFLTLSTCIWVVSFGLQDLFPNQDSFLLFIKLAYLGGVPYIPACFFIFSSIWAGKTPKPAVRALWLTWSFAVSAVSILFTRKFFNFSQNAWGIYPLYDTSVSGVIYLCALIVPFLINFVLTTRNAYLGMKNSISPREKAQFRNFLTGFLIAYMGMFDFAVALGAPMYPLGYFYLTTFIGVVAYTIVRHQIFDINILVRRFAVVVFIYVILLGAVLPFGSIIISSVSRPYVPNLIGLSALFGIFLSLGPLIYAYLLRHSYWLRSKSATGLAHELKSPLNNIQNAVDFLVTQNTSDQPNKTKIFEYLAMVQKNAQRLELFANDLLKLAKIQDDNIVLEKMLTNLHDLINETKTSYSAKNGHTVNITSDDTIPEIEIDRPRIHQVVSNLLSNALKFSEKGAINIALERNQQFVVCSVTDQGKGIPKHDLEKIFNRFYQGKHTAKGSGIGLTIAKAWVEAHGGKIWADSAGEGKGTTVSFTLPITS